MHEADRKKRDWESRLEIQAGVFIVYGLAACVMATLQAYWPGGKPLSPLVAVVLAIWATHLNKTHPVAGICEVDQADYQNGSAPYEPRGNGGGF